MKKDGFLKYGFSALFCLCVIFAMVVGPAAAGTESVTVTKYCDNNYSAVDDSAALTYTYLKNTYTPVYSNGPVYMQGLVTPDDWNATGYAQNLFDNGWDLTESVKFSNYGEHNGTSIEDILSEVGNMSPGSELLVADSTYPKADRYFSYDNVYNPASCQGDMILTWWDSVDGNVTTWSKGMRLFFYTPPATYGVADSLNLTNMDMKTAFGSWYYQFAADKYSDFIGPSAKGLSVQTVDTIKIFPAHRYDFATGGDTVESAYSMNTQITVPADLAKIATDNGITYDTSSAVNGEKASQRFVFDLSEDAANIEKLAFTWDGTGSHDSGVAADQGATTYIWDGTGYDAFTGDITTGISDYVVNGDVTVLVEQNAVSVTNPPPGKISHLSTDYVKLVVTHHHSN